MMIDDDEDAEDGHGGREWGTRAVDGRRGERRTKASRRDRWTRDSTRRDAIEIRSRRWWCFDLI